MMQMDMHYYGTYVLARAAGMGREHARVVATASQFVDDHAHKESVELRDGARIDSQATAHHAADIKNIDRVDQRRVWVPFHFLPGNEGEGYTERLICRMDSPVAREMIVKNSSLAAESPFGLELLGITAHAYADTFSHYGFSGISSRWNRVINNSIVLHGLGRSIETYIRDKATSFFYRHGEQGGLMQNIKRWFVSWGGETLSGALGHGAVATYPDRPYLNWDFDYEYPERRSSIRRNDETYLLACMQLHRMFKEFLDICPRYAQWDGVAFESIEPHVIAILQAQEDMAGRIGAWQNAAGSGVLLAGRMESIPVYTPWHGEWSELAWLDDSTEAVSFSLYRYFQAASTHRNYVLRRLLPLHGLVVH